MDDLTNCCLAWRSNDLPCLLVQVLLFSQLKVQLNSGCVQSPDAYSSNNLSDFCCACMLCTEASYCTIVGCLRLPELAGVLSVYLNY